VKELVPKDHPAIPDDTDHGAFLTLRKMCSQAIHFDTLNHRRDLTLGGISLHYDHHGVTSFTCFLQDAYWIT
jgi:hypothetical protein